MRPRRRTLQGEQGFQIFEAHLYARWEMAARLRLANGSDRFFAIALRASQAAVLILPKACCMAVALCPCQRALDHVSDWPGIIWINDAVLVSRICVLLRDYMA